MGIKTALLTWNKITSCEGITGISSITRTKRTMIAYPTFGVLSARWINAWVNTFLVKTCFIGGTFRRNCTFRSTSRRLTHKFRQTGTNCLLINLSTLGVGATWRWLTRIYIFITDRLIKKQKGKWKTNKLFKARVNKFGLTFYWFRAQTIGISGIAVYTVTGR